MVGKVLDLSNYDAPGFDAQCMAAAGVERVILGCWNQGATLGLMRGARSVGIIVEDLYTFVYYGLSWERREVENALNLARTEGGIKRVWVDCEATFTDWPGDLDTETPGMTPAERVAITKAVVAQVEAAGLAVGIYSGAWWWPNKMANSPAFRHLPLWVSDYGTNDPANPREPLRTVNFGGWTVPAVHQYSSTIPVCGRERDHNYWFLDEEDESMSDDDLLAVFAGAEERDAAGNVKSREDRLAVARFRRDEAAAGRAPSVRDLAAGSHVHPPVAGVADHLHISGEVIR